MELLNLIRNNFPAYLSISKYGSEPERVKFVETDSNELNNMSCTTKSAKLKIFMSNLLTIAWYWSRLKKLRILEVRVLSLLYKC